MTPVQRVFVAVHYLDQCRSYLSATYLDKMGQSYPQTLAKMTYLTKYTEDPNFGPTGIPELLRETLTGCVSQACSNATKWPSSLAFLARVPGRRGVPAGVLRGDPSHRAQ